MLVRFPHVAAAIGIFIPVLAGAFTRLPTTPSERLTRADVVFAGIVISPVLSRPTRCTQEKVITYIFRVTHVWKGSVGDSIAVGLRTRLSADHYLIYASQGSTQLLGDMFESSYPLIADAAYDLYTLPPPARSLGVRDLPTVSVVSLLADLDDPIEITRARAASALGNIGEMPEHVVPALTQLLAGGDKCDRIQAAIALGKFGSKAEEAVPVLAHSLRTDDIAVREEACKALGQIRQPVPVVVTALKHSLRDESEWVRFYSAIGLGQIGPPAEEAADALAKTLGDEDKDVRCQAIRALGKLGPAAGDAVQDLATVLDDQDLQVAQLAAMSLGQIGEKAAVLIPSLIRDLKQLELTANFDDSTWQTRVVAISVLGSVARKPKTVVPALINALADPNSSVRAHAAWALGCYGPEATSAVLPLAHGLDHDEMEVRCRCAESLGQIGCGAWLAAPALTRATTNEDETLQGIAKKAYVAVTCGR